MKKTTYTGITDGNQLTVDIRGLMKILNTGEATARQIGQAAGATMKVGRRRLYYVPKIREYLKTLTETA